MKSKKAEACETHGVRVEESGRNPEGAVLRAEAESAADARTKAERCGLMEAVCERGHLRLAYQRVVANKGATGVDGIGVAEFKDHLKQHWPTIKAKLLAGTYHPQPVPRHSQAASRGQDARHSDADGPADPASVASSAQSDLRSGLLRVELRLPTGEERPSGGQGSEAICRRRPKHCGGYRPGEVLRC